MNFSRTAARRRRATALNQMIQDMGDQLKGMSQALARFNNFTLSNAEEEDHRIIIGGNDDQAFIRSGNYDDNPNDPEGFNIRSDGQININNDLVLGGSGSDPNHLQLYGGEDGNWITRSLWEGVGGNWEIGTRGYGTERNPLLDEYGDFLIAHNGQEVFRAKSHTASAPTVTFPPVVQMR